MEVCIRDAHTFSNDVFGYGIAIIPGIIPAVYEVYGLGDWFAKMTVEVLLEAKMVREDISGQDQVGRKLYVGARKDDDGKQEGEMITERSPANDC
jgi:hypothetical protein